MYKYLSILIIFLLLSGCARFSAQPSLSPSSSSPSDPDWKTRAKALERIHHWSIQGAMSVQYEDKTNLASLKWDQQNQYYQFVVSGPLGIGRIEIMGEPEMITLKQSNHIQPVSAATPEQLMQSQLGWYVPLSHLFYWVRGLPAPSVSKQFVLDREKRLAHLKQDHWLIEYARYKQVDEFDLPQTIYLTHDQLKVKLVIRDWQIPHPMR